MAARARDLVALAGEVLRRAADDEGHLAEGTLGGVALDQAARATDELLVGLGELAGDAGGAIAERPPGRPGSRRPGGGTRRASGWRLTPSGWRTARGGAGLAGREPRKKKRRWGGRSRPEQQQGGGPRHGDDAGADVERRADQPEAGIGHAGVPASETARGYRREQRGGLSARAASLASKQERRGHRGVGGQQRAGRAGVLGEDESRSPGAEGARGEIAGVPERGGDDEEGAAHVTCRSGRGCEGCSRRAGPGRRRRSDG